MSARPTVGPSPSLIAEMRRFAAGEGFDEEPLPDLDSEALDFRAASELFAPVRRVARRHLQSLRLVTLYQGRKVPTVGGLLLFGRDRLARFPDAWIQAGRFAGTDRTRILDQARIEVPLPAAIEAAVAFGEYESADKAAIERELAKVVAGIEAAGMDPEDSPKVQELRARLAGEAVDLDALEAEVYDHLYRFFRRYYSEGDFLSKRVYKEGVYAILYEGEEVKLHWANADQYSIKTSEYLRDYTFRLAPDDAKNPRRVHFRLVDAAEGEHGNVKESNRRVFVLAAGDFLTEEDGELVATKRSPRRLRQPKQVLRQITAGRISRSARLLVGATPSRRRNVHSETQRLRRSQHRARALGSGLRR